MNSAPIKSQSTECPGIEGPIIVGEWVECWSLDDADLNDPHLAPALRLERERSMRKKVRLERRRLKRKEVRRRRRERRRNGWGE